MPQSLLLKPAMCSTGGQAHGVVLASAIFDGLLSGGTLLRNKVTLVSHLSSNGRLSLLRTASYFWPRCAHKRTRLVGMASPAQVFNSFPELALFLALNWRVESSDRSSSSLVRTPAYPLLSAHALASKFLSPVIPLLVGIQ